MPNRRRRLRMLLNEAAALHCLIKNPPPEAKPQPTQTSGNLQEAMRSSRGTWASVREHFAGVLKSITSARKPFTSDFKSITGARESIASAGKSITSAGNVGQAPGSDAQLSGNLGRLQQASDRLREAMRSLREASAGKIKLGQLGLRLPFSCPGLYFRCRCFFLP